MLKCLSFSSGTIADKQFSKNGPFKFSHYLSKKISIFAAMKHEKFQKEVIQAVKILKDGGVILYPTDTVWGIGCNAEDQKAVEKILNIKGERAGKSFIVLVNEERLLHKYSKEFPEVCYDLIDVSEEPITIIYPNAQNLPKTVVAKDNSVGMRITNHPFSSRVIQQLKSGLISTSANISGEKTDGSFHDISKEVIDQVDYIVDLEQSEKMGRPSSIIKIGNKGEVEVIRK